MRKSLCFMRPLLSQLAWLKNLLCYMIHYGTYRGAVVGLRGAVVGIRGAAVGVRGAAVGNIGIPTYVISRSAVIRQPIQTKRQKHTSAFGLSVPKCSPRDKYLVGLRQGAGIAREKVRICWLRNSVFNFSNI